MIMNSVLVQIISYGVGITIHINIPVFPEIHRHIGRIQLCQLPGIGDPRQHITYNIPPVPVVIRKLREKIIPLLVIFKHLRKQSCALHPILKLFKIYGHFTEYQRCLPMLPCSLPSSSPLPPADSTPSKKSHIHDNRCGTHKFFLSFHSLSKPISD